MHNQGLGGSAQVAIAMEICFQRFDEVCVLPVVVLLQGPQVAVAKLDEPVPVGKIEDELKYAQVTDIKRNVGLQPLSQIKRLAGVAIAVAPGADFARRLSKADGDRARH